MKKDTYAKTEEPRELSDADLAFLSEVCWSSLGYATFIDQNDLM